MAPTKTRKKIPPETRSKPAESVGQTKASVSARGRRFTHEQKDHALRLIVSGMKRPAVAKVIGTTTESLRRWVRMAEEGGTIPEVPLATPRKSDEEDADVQVVESGQQPAVQAAPTAGASLYAPKDPGQGLSQMEQEAILELKKKHPSFGPAQIRAQLKRFRGWRISIKAIKRVLLANGYELVHRGSRPKGDEPIRFEAPRPNALWQIDYCELRLPEEKLHLLVAIDDFSRYMVGHALADSPSSQVATTTLLEAIARHGKPEKVRTDRGGAFVAKTEENDFARVLEAEDIDHIVGRSYHPQGGGKVESLIGTVRRELWDVEHFDDRHQAERRLAEFFAEYNHQRAHMGIDGLTPADRYHGRADRVLSAMNTVSRRRQMALSMQAQAGDPFEEMLGFGPEAPLEVLRLVLCDGVMELRFCGARVRLGKIES